MSANSETRPRRAIHGNYEDETIAYCKKHGWQHYERVEALVVAARSAAIQQMERMPVGFAIMSALHALAQVEPGMCAYLRTFLAKLNIGNRGAIRRIVIGGEWEKRKLKHAATRERQLKREAQRIIAEGIEKTILRMANQCTTTELQLIQDMAATGGSLRAIGKLRRERGEKKAKCHP